MDKRGQLLGSLGSRGAVVAQHHDAVKVAGSNPVVSTSVNHDIIYT